jgi:hypothetical protein
MKQVSVSQCLIEAEMRKEWLEQAGIRWTIKNHGHELGSGMTIGLQARQPSLHAGMTLPGNEINLPEVLI